MLLHWGPPSFAALPSSATAAAALLQPSQLSALECRLLPPSVGAGRLEQVRGRRWVVPHKRLCSRHRLWSRQWVSDQDAGGGGSAPSQLISCR